MTDLRECVEELDKLEDTITGMRCKLSREIRRQRRFAADASHELRTPIAGLRVSLEEAALNPQNTDLENLLSHALSNVDRLQAIVTDLFVLAELEASTGAGECQAIDLAKIFQMQVYRRVDQHRINLRCRPGILVKAAPEKIGRMLAELLDNAQRHAEHVVEVELSNDSRYAVLTVADDGPGIAEADRQRVFDRFIRLDEARSRDLGGTGLGLTIARDIVSSHGGTIHVEDSSLGGTRFVVRLPLASPAVSMSSAGVSGNGHRGG
ncbi:sensor histidine kinase [Streptosporangium sp. NPDC002721]|uniref:sensor histidine kinase n=1 Tax=Streptosporangium sp. NPDC002721 TaxID=3366188 RepID=UPI0036B4D975